MLHPWSRPDVVRVSGLLRIAVKLILIATTDKLQNQYNLLVAIQVDRISNLNSVKAINHVEISNKWQTIVDQHGFEVDKSRQRWQWKTIIAQLGKTSPRSPIGSVGRQVFAYICDCPFINMWTSQWQNVSTAKASSDAQLCYSSSYRHYSRACQRNSLNGLPINYCKLTNCMPSNVAYVVFGALFNQVEAFVERP